MKLYRVGNKKTVISCRADDFYQRWDDMDRVLIVYSEKTTENMLCEMPTGRDIEADTVHDRKQALAQIKTGRYDLALLDADIGVDAVGKLRADGITIPVIIFGEIRDEEIVYALDSGADDCISKTLNSEIMCAKVKALIRRSRILREREEKNDIVAGPFLYDISMLRLYKSGREIVLTSKENAIIKLFMDNPNRIFSKGLIYEMVWGGYIADENAVMVYINRLRRKVEDDPLHPQYIRNVRGLGYRFVI